MSDTKIVTLTLEQKVAALVTRKHRSDKIVELLALLADAKLNALLDQAEIARLKDQLRISIEECARFEANNKHLQAQIATLECIMEREAEKTNQALHPYPET